jgi:hypothetical protein
VHPDLSTGAGVKVILQSPSLCSPPAGAWPLGSSGFIWSLETTIVVLGFNFSFFYLLIWLFFFLVRLVVVEVSKYMQAAFSRKSPNYFVFENTLNVQLKQESLI